MINDDEINIGIDYYYLDKKIMFNQYNDADLIMYIEILLLLKDYKSIRDILNNLDDKHMVYKEYILNKIKSKNSITYYNRVLADYRLTDNSDDYKIYLQNMYKKSNDMYYLFLLGVKHFENHNYIDSKNVFCDYITKDGEYYIESIFYLLYISTILKDNNMYDNCINILKNCYNPIIFNISNDNYEECIMSYINDFNVSKIYCILKELNNYTNNKVKSL